MRKAALSNNKLQNHNVNNNALLRTLNSGGCWANSRWLFQYVIRPWPMTSLAYCDVASRWPPTASSHIQCQNACEWECFRYPVHQSLWIMVHLRPKEVYQEHLLWSHVALLYTRRGARSLSVRLSVCLSRARSFMAALRIASNCYLFSRPHGPIILAFFKQNVDAKFRRYHGDVRTQKGPSF